MKLNKVTTLLLVGLAFATSTFAKEKTTVKLNFTDIRSLLLVLPKLDGTVVLDSDKKQITIPYTLKGSTRIGISHDLTILLAAQKDVMDSWQKYLKTANITDEDKETLDQKKVILDILNTKQDVSLYTFEEKEFVQDDSTDNPIPPTLLTLLAPLIK